MMDGDVAERAYRTVHPRSLWVQLLVLIAAEAVLFVMFARLGAELRWGATLVVALAAASLVLLAGLVLTGAPWPRFLILTVLGLHVAAIVVDVLAGSDGTGEPAGRGPGMWTWIWMAIAVASTAAYLTALTLWLRARSGEVAAGMSAGVGLTGAAVFRRQVDPRLVPLAFEQRPGSARPIVLLLHGLGATMAFWRPVARELENLGVPSLTPDLLGFGASIRLGTRFRTIDQAEAVIRLITAHAGGPVLVVAHSYGAAVAVQVAIERPDLVDGLVLIEPAAFADVEEARRRLGARSWLIRTTVNGSRAADWACGVMCLFRIPLVALAPRLARRYSRAVTPDVARGAVTYVWPAYRDALASLLHTNPLTGWLERPLAPTMVIVGASDRTVPSESIRTLVSEDVRFEEVPGTHALPLEHPAVIAALIVGARP